MADETLKPERQAGFDTCDVVRPGNGVGAPSFSTFRGIDRSACPLVDPRADRGRLALKDLGIEMALQMRSFGWEEPGVVRDRCLSGADDVYAVRAVELIVITPVRAPDLLPAQTLHEVIVPEPIGLFQQLLVPISIVCRHEDRHARLPD